MKKSELRKIIRKTISEQMGTAGPRPQVPNKGARMGGKQKSKIK